MMIQSTAVTFGAVGTPVLVGVQGGVGGEMFEAQLAMAGIEMREFLRLVTARAVIFHGVAGTLMPTFMVMMTTRFFGETEVVDRGALHLSLRPLRWAGLHDSLYPDGDLPRARISLPPGGAGGVDHRHLAAKRGFLVPEGQLGLPPGPDWPADWVSGLEVKEAEEPGDALSTGLAWAPYLLLAVLLVISRLPQLPVGNWLRWVRVAWEDIFGTGISAVTTPLYLPGFVLSGRGCHDLLHAPDDGACPRRAVSESSRVLLGAGFVLVFTVPMVRVYINSDVNGAGFFSMPIAMAEWVATNVGQVWPMFAGVTGALGAFIAGSNTVSNLMFSAFQYGVAERLMVSGVLIVALQAVGAAAGNMIAIHNVVAASATVGLLGREGATLRKTILPTIYYLLVIGVLGL